MKFNSTFRVLFDSDPDPLNQQISAKIAAIDQAAAEIRQRGGSPYDELRDTVNRLKSAVEKARIEQAALYRAQIEQARIDYEKAIVRTPSTTLLAIERAKNRIQAMTPDQAESLAMHYVSGAESLDVFTLNELRSALIRSGNQATLESVNQAATERRTDHPWISGDPDVAQIANRADILDSLTADQVHFSDADGQSAVFHIDGLIDFENELSREVPTGQP
jgi:hypothetical protein